MTENSVDDENDDVFEDVNLSPVTRTQNEEIIRRLANDYIHFKIFGKDGKDPRTVQKPRKKKRATRTLSQDEESLLNKAKRVLRKTSCELERDNAIFFENVITDTQPETAKLSFRTISKEVLKPDDLNWGRIVSLFVYGGIVAEEFWKQQQEDKVEEVEGWLTETIIEREEWIQRQGGWNDFSETFEVNPVPYGWLLKPTLVAAGVALVGLLGMKYGS